MKITILGCGAYGLALGKSFLGNDITMWSKFQKEVDSLTDSCSKLKFTTDLEQATRETDLVVIAIPVAFLEETLREYKKYYHGEDILIASKGIDTDTLKFAYEIVNDCLGAVAMGVISGGTFATDMGKGKVMGLTLSTTSEEIITKVRQGLADSHLKVQVTNDMIGVSVCGSIKNVMAIGFGMLDGALYPESSRFLFLTEAIYEIKKLIVELGGTSETIMSYAGIDDIMMTCTSAKSRNYSLGRMIGENRTSEEIAEYKNKTTIEGLGTSKAIYLLSEKKDIVLPIVAIIYKILYEDGKLEDLISYLEEKEV